MKRKNIIICAAIIAATTFLFYIGMAFAYSTFDIVKMPTESKEVAFCMWMLLILIFSPMILTNNDIKE